MRKVTATQAKAHLAALIDEVCRGRHVLIEKHGQPVAALVSAQDLESLAPPRATRPAGALALAGAWGGVGDEEIDEMVEFLYGERDRDTGRAVELE